MLRAVAATGVLVSHVAFVTGVVNPERVASDLRLLLPRLDVGVPIFFVLSGLLIARPFVAAVADGRSAPVTARYLARRAARIYPLYWFVLAVTFATSDAPLPGTRDLLSFVTLTHIYRPATAIGPITQSWSLATEVSFYVLIPVWFALCRRMLDRRGVAGRRDRLAAMAVGLVAWLVVALVWRGAVVAVTDTFDFTVPGAVDVRGALLTWLPNHLDNFGVGVALAIVLELRRDRPLPIPPAARAGAYVTAAVALWVVAAHLGLPPLHTGFDGPQTFARHGLFVAIAALVVTPSALALAGSVRRNDRATGSSAVQNRLGGVLGRVGVAAGMASYGVYLWHQWVTDEWFARPGHPVFRTPFPTTLAVVLGGSAVLAAVTYWLVERWPQRIVDHVSSAPNASPATTRELKAAPVLDGLRGLSILAVLGTHVIFLDPARRDGVLRGGFLGVDVFLVLSGFLISATLLRERDRTGTVDLGKFLGRRARRLVPPLAAFFAIHALVVLILGDPIVEELRQAALSLTFTSNWQLTFGHQPPYDLVHLWSLAAEGQLYVLCGLAVWWARDRLDETSRVVGGLLLAALAVAVWRLVQFRMGLDLEALYERTDVRADSMILGGLAAVAWRTRLVPDRVARIAGAVGGAAIVVAWFVTEPRAPWLFGGGFSLIAFAAAAAVLGALAGERSPVAVVAGWRPLMELGKVSYSLYLWHLPIYLWTARALPDGGVAVRLPIAVGASLAAAMLSCRFVEQPYLSRRAGQSATSAAVDTVTR